MNKILYMITILNINYEINFINICDQKFINYLLRLMKISMF